MVIIFSPTSLLLKARHEAPDYKQVTSGYLGTCIYLGLFTNCIYFLHNLLK